MAILGWENSERIQFTIDTTGQDIECVPFPFKISSSVGATNYNNTFIIDKLTTLNNSIANRKKVMFTQICDGEEQPLYAELDTWDHFNRKALFWVRPKTFYNNNINIFYLYFDKTQDDNVSYIAETNIVPISLFMSPGHTSYDSTELLPIELLYIDGVYKLWLIGSNGSVWTILYTESTDFDNWTTFITPLPKLHSSPEVKTSIFL